MGIGWLDYGNRRYLPELARFVTIDPASEELMQFSPYLYAVNNPVRYIDFLGLGPGDRVKKALSLVGKEYYRKAKAGEKADSERYLVELDTKLRTEDTEEALKYMDCAEFVARVIADDGITDGVKHMGSGAFKDFLSNDEQFENSDAPKVDDIALWDGHVAIVTDVNGDGKVQYTQARGRGKLSGTTKYFITPEQNKPGAKFYGYYRPKAEKPDKSDKKNTTSSEKANTQKGSGPTEAPRLHDRQVVTGNQAKREGRDIINVVGLDDW